MKARVLILFCIAQISAVALLPAQQLRTHKLPAKGIEIKVPSFMKLVPTKAADQLTLAKFAGKIEARVAGTKGEREMIYLLFRIDKSKGKSRGSGSGASDGWNSAATVNNYLATLGFRNDLAENSRVFKKRPLRNAEKATYKIYDHTEVDWSIRGMRERVVTMRAYLVESKAELFGLVTIGAALEAFDKAIVKSVKSIKRTAPVASEVTAQVGDIYANLDLRDVDKRMKVRAALVAGWSAHDTEDFILVTNVPKKRLVENLLTDLKIMREAYLDRFPPVGEIEAVSIVRVCDSYDDYLRYAGYNMDGTGGYWSAKEGELVIFNPGRKIPEARAWLAKIDASATLYHEAMHQYFYYANGNLAPAPWFGEGYGEYFGGAKVDRRKGGIKEIKRNKFRMEWIRRAKRDKAWPDLAAFLRIDQQQFYAGGVRQNYAFAWAFCYFLEQEGKKKPGVRNELWASIPDNYLIHLRRITKRERGGLEITDAVTLSAIFGDVGAIQEEAYQVTFSGIDIRSLERAWIAEMKRWK